MASTEVEQPPKHNKTCVLRVSIHCEGCKRKVKKLLQSVPGVDDIEIERLRQRVVVTGDVSADTLLRKLVKAGKHAQLWPEAPETLHRKIEKPSSTSQVTVTEESVVSGKEIKSVGEKKPETHVEKQPEKGNTSASGAGAPASSEGEKVDGGEKKAVEVKGEEKKPETGPAEGEPSPAVVENKVEKIAENGGGGGSSGVGEGKKKKKKKPVNSNGNNSNNGNGNGNVGGGPHATMARSNESPPRHHGYGYPPHHPGYEYPPRQYYAPPPAPVYTMSYNTAHPPANSYTTSYYAPQPPQSYAYSHSETPTPHVAPGYESYTYQPQQQSDSFEMFSDENPNGCLVM
ncbi:heavy metal transport/detoxification superfamily protein [Artemisia annua]|uniref:Heavy metal transport/detoxification superfamily protein n=1 Tax=Artemisia annua TaxID=35608 RepID=A0A2U1NWE5_ARTAN|nr:heavy metal transport/detoxification superfamily protein [Artemisia annua]